MQRDILVYAQYPASTGSLLPSLSEIFPTASYNIRRIYQGDIKNGILRQPESRLLILPGITGEHSGYTAQLDKAALDDIHHFVSANNNALLTICAGTYFVCRETLYDPPWRQAKTKQSLRPLFNALARGPVPPHGLQPGPASHFNDVSIIPVQYKAMNGQWHKTGVCYGNGPGIHPDTQGDPDMEILAVYDAAPGKPAALVRQRIGAGSAYLCSILPEIGWQDIRPHPGLQHLTELMDDLKPHEAGRAALWHDLGARIRRDIG